MKKGKNKVYIVISIITIILDCAIDILLLKMIRNRNEDQG